MNSKWLLSTIGSLPYKMSDEVCKYVISRGRNKGTQCEAPAVKDGYCKTHRELRSVKNTLRDQCRHVFVDDEGEGSRCDEKAVKDGYCESCYKLKEVQTELSTRCKHILTKGRNAGNRCVEPAFDQGYCQRCLKKTIVQDRLAKGSEDEKPKRRIVIAKEDSSSDLEKESDDEEPPQFVVTESDEEMTDAPSIRTTCRLCHSARLFPVTVTGPSGVPDPEDGFLEGRLCLNCGLLQGPKWPLKGPDSD